MASFHCASGCGFVSKRCSTLFLSGRHLNIFPLSLCWLLIMWRQGLLCFLLKAFAWDYSIIIFESDNSVNIKQRAVRSFACHLSPFQWVSSGILCYLFPLLHPFDVLSSEASLSSLLPFSYLVCLFTYLWASADFFKEGAWTCQISLQWGSSEQAAAALLLSIFIFLKGSLKWYFPPHVLQGYLKFSSRKPTLSMKSLIMIFPPSFAFHSNTLYLL